MRVFPVATGTAANALSLAAIGPSWGNIYCSEPAHINTSEANAAGFFGGGLKLVPVAGSHGRIDPAVLRDMLAALDPAELHRGQPPGSTSRRPAISARSTARRHPRDCRGRQAHGLKLHMDGARSRTRWRGSASARPS